jgi:hypothetical protein
VLPESYQPKKYPSMDCMKNKASRSKFIDAINQTLKEEFRANPEYLYLGTRRCYTKKKVEFSMSLKECSKSLEGKEFLMGRLQRILF